MPYLQRSSSQNRRRATPEWRGRATLPASRVRLFMEARLAGAAKSPASTRTGDKSRIPFCVSHNCRIGPVRRYRNLCTVHNLQKITPVAKNFWIFLLTGSVVFGNVILDCGRFTCDCARLSCGGGHFPFGQCLSGVGHAGSRRPDADFPFGLFRTGG
jgi:hypothetical protein